MEIVVTHIENVRHDEDGKPIIGEDGIPELIDPDAVGVLAKTHIVPMTHVADGQVQTGISTVCEVFWDKIRTPAPALLPPVELWWLSVHDGSDVLDDNDEEIEEVEDLEAEPDSDSDDEGYF